MKTYGGSNYNENIINFQVSVIEILLVNLETISAVMVTVVYPSNLNLNISLKHHETQVDYNKANQYRISKCKKIGFNLMEIKFAQSEHASKSKHPIKFV